MLKMGYIQKSVSWVQLNHIFSFPKWMSVDDCECKFLNNLMASQYFFIANFFLWVLKILLQLCVLNHLSCVQLFVTVWTVVCQAPLSMGFCRIPEWVAMPYSRGSFQSRNQSCISYVSCIGSELFTTDATWEAPIAIVFQFPVKLMCPRSFAVRRKKIENNF